MDPPSEVLGPSGSLSSLGCLALIRVVLFVGLCFRFVCFGFSPLGLFPHCPFLQPLPRFYFIDGAARKAKNIYEPPVRFLSQLIPLLECGLVIFIVKFPPRTA